MKVPVTIHPYFFSDNGRYRPCGQTVALKRGHFEVVINPEAIIAGTSCPDINVIIHKFDI